MSKQQQTTLTEQTRQKLTEEHGDLGAGCVAVAGRVRARAGVDAERHRARGGQAADADVEDARAAWHRRGGTVPKGVSAIRNTVGNTRIQQNSR